METRQQKEVPQGIEKQRSAASPAQTSGSTAKSESAATLSGIQTMQKEFQRQMQALHQLVATNTEKQGNLISQLRSEVNSIAQMRAANTTNESSAPNESALQARQNREANADTEVNHLEQTSGGSLTNASFHSHPSYSAKKIYPLPKFDGQPEAWPTFIEDLRRTTEEFGYSELHNIMRIRESLHGRAREIVGSLLSSSQNVNAILEILEETFGRPEQLIKSQIEAVRKLPNIKERNLDELVELAVKVNNMATFLKLCKGEHHLTNPTLLSEIVAKLPVARQMQWAEKCVEMDHIPNVEDLSKWLSALRKLANFVSDTLPSTSNENASAGSKAGSQKDAHKNNEGKGNKKHAFTSVAGDICFVCEKKCNDVTSCGKFSSLSVDERWEKVREAKLCFSCLKGTHRADKCFKKLRCGVDNCNRKHHKLLHKPLKDNIPAEEDKERLPTPGVNLHVATHNQCVLFQLVRIKLYGPKGSVTIFAFVDDGADVTMLDWDIAQHIGLQGKNTPLHLQWLNGKSATGSSKIVNCDISGIEYGDKRYRMSNVYLSKDLDLPTQTLSIKSMSKFAHIAGLPLTEYQKAKPKMVLSLTHAFLTVPLDAPISPPFSGPIAINTRLGWILYGPISEDNEPVKRSCHARINNGQDSDVSMNEMMRRFFDVESCGVKLDAPPLIADDVRRALDIMNATLQFKDGRYECGLTWKEQFTQFPDSYGMALKRFYALEKQMMRNSDFRTQYRDAVEDFLNKSYARKLSSTEAGEMTPKTFFLPHFGVVNPNKQKIRIVFDAAAKCEGISLNDALLPGPDLNQPLVAVLMKFRTEPIAVCGDLREMFLQVAIRKEDQDAFRFLWRPNSEKNIQQYVMTRMIFGATCSPTIAQFVKNTHARKFAQKYSRAVTAIIERHYVDDYVDCFRSEEEAIQTIKQVKEIHSGAGFELCKIISNSSLVSSELQKESTAKINVAADRMERVLGLFWLPATDEFVFSLNFHRVPKDVFDKKRKPSKREVLSVTMSVFDPFGFLSNLVIAAKVLMQLLWKSGTEWDEPIPDDLHGRWVAWLGKLENVRDFKIPRCYFTEFHCARKDLHIFSDASEQAMAVVAFWRISHEYDIRLAFVMGKTNCAPTRSMSIPRLELQAAVYAVRLKNCIEKFHGFEADSVQYWSDSHTVIRWLKKESRLYKQFVANRIAEILDSSDEKDWRWVPGALNPADDGTRAEMDFHVENRWKNGPPFLLLPEKEWPVFVDVPPTGQDDEELKRNTGFVLATRNVKMLYFDANNSSNYNRLWRGIAWALRFAFNVLTLLNQKPKRMGMLTTQELEEAEVFMWRAVQMEAFSHDYENLADNRPISGKSELKTLNPYLDKDGLIRCSGRIDNAPYLKWESKRPIILPKNHRLTRLLVEWYHRRLQHVNKHTVVNEIRLRFWIPCIRVLVNSVFAQCIECKKRRAMPSPPIMGLLPVDRLTPFVRAFTYSGVDFFGPVEVSCHRRRGKRWVALFTCMATRAVHLEVAMDLSSDAFLVCIRNFINRRGVPIQIRSDNGTNFVGLAKELNKDPNFLDHDSITAGLAPLGIEWKFNTPANPSEGGVWERLVRSVKRSLSFVMKEQAPRVETLISLLIECENVVNSRPLTHLPVTPSEPDPLTPNHFLLGCTNSTQTPAPFEKRLCALRKQWRLLQNLKNLFWQRWMQEYLPELTRRVKWCRPTKPLTVGSLVLICDSDMPRSRWKRGRILKLNVGADGVARSATVQFPTGLLRRPISKLAPLDVSDDECGEGPSSIHGGGDVGNPSKRK